MTSEDTARTDFSGAPWVELIKLLLQGEQETRANVSHKSWLPLRYSEQVAQLKREEAPHKLEVVRAIDWWLDRGHWPPFSAEEKYQAHLRFEAALTFLGLAIIGPDQPDPRTIFPFPPLNRRVVARWILIDWWQARGIEFLCSLADPHEPIDGQ